MKINRFKLKQSKGEIKYIRYLHSECAVFRQIYLRFMEYQMEHSNECKKNFVAVYDGSSAIENLKAKFCSTVANDVMLDNGVGVVRMWADEKSRLSRFRMLFTSFVDRKSRFFFFTSTWTLLSHLPPSHHLNYILLASYDNKSFVRWMGANFCASEVRPFDCNGNVSITFQSPHHDNHRLLVYSRMRFEVWCSKTVSFIIKDSEVLWLKNTICFSYKLTASFSSHTEKLHLCVFNLLQQSRTPAEVSFWQAKLIRPGFKFTYETRLSTSTFMGWKLSKWLLQQGDAVATICHKWGIMKELVCFGLKQIAERVNVPRGNNDKQEASTFLKGEEISDTLCPVCISKCSKACNICIKCLNRREY